MQTGRGHPEEQGRKGDVQLEAAACVEGMASLGTYTAGAHGFFGEEGEVTDGIALRDETGQGGKI